MLKKRRTIELTENRLRGIITECVRTILLESQESKSQSEAIQYLMDNKGYDNEKANKIVRIDLRNDITALRDKKIAKFTLGVVRMLCNGEIRNANDICNLNTTLKLMEPHLKDYDRNLNNMTCQELIARFESVRSNNIEAEKAEIDSMDFGKSDYDIVRIDSFDDARLYANYTDWCLTYREDMFNKYTMDGFNQIYFCLRHGFENVPREAGDDAPLDEYGLSMISVIVNGSGELAHSTCRWNHEEGGSDSVMSAKEISQVVGVNFYNTFKPNGKWEAILSGVSERLSNGESFDEVFDECRDAKIDGLFIVRLLNKYTYLKSDGTYLTNDWFDCCYGFIDGFGIVGKNGKYTYLKADGDYLRNEWFNWCGNFHEGITVVEKNGKETYLKSDGTYLRNEWFDKCNNFYGGFAVVKKDGKYTYLKADGTYLTNEWFDKCQLFSEGFAVVKKDGKYTYLKADGTYLTNKWFDWCYDFYEGISGVQNGVRRFIIDKNGVLTPFN